MLHQYFMELFRNGQSARKSFQIWLWRSWKTRCSEQFGSIDGLLLRSFTYKISDGKTYGDDPTVAEMLDALGEETWDWLAYSCQLLLLSHHSESEGEPWEALILQFISKKTIPNHPSSSRPITVFPVLLELYMAVIVELEHHNLTDLPRPYSRCIRTAPSMP